MYNSNDIQTGGSSYYRVIINGNDETKYVEGGITITEQEDFMVSCSFSVFGGRIQNRIARFQRIEIFGGSDDPLNQKWLFRGQVKACNITHPANGVPSVRVEGYGGAFRASNIKTAVYPTPKSDRAWAMSSSIKLSEIVNNILNETFFSFTKNVNIVHDVVFTLKKPFVQQGSDWQALKLLARIANCNVSETLDENGIPTINFLDAKFKLRNEREKVIRSFRYYERDEEEFGFPAIDPSVNPSNEIRIIEGSLSMDVNLNQGSLRVVTDFGSTNGDESKTYIIKEDDKEQIMAYELKPESFFNSLSDDLVTSLSNRLWNNPDSITEEELLKYFNPVSYNDSRAPGYMDGDLSNEGAGQLGFIGYEYTAQVLGDIKIIPYKRYPLFGIGKYSSRPDGKNKYYLRSITHQLGDDDAYRQTLNFYR